MLVEFESYTDNMLYLFFIIEHSYCTTRFFVYLDGVLPWFNSAN